MNELLGTLIVFGLAVLALAVLGTGFYAGYRQGYRDAQQESSRHIQDLLTKYGARR